MPFSQRLNLVTEAVRMRRPRPVEDAPRRAADEALLRAVLGLAPDAPLAPHTTADRSPTQEEP